MRPDLYVSLRRSGIHPESLKDLQRIILTTDGTVTDILEAYFRERMIVNVLRQDSIPTDTLPQAEQAVLRLDPDKPGEALRREILLRGEISESCYLYAASVIAVDRLPAAIRVALLEKKQAIGHILLDQRIATFKEIVDCRREPAGAIAKAFAIAVSAPLISRTYVLSVEDQPIMVITEKVPEFGR